MEYFSNRKTIRRYTAEPISTTELKEMLEAAMHAPTCGGMQLYSVVVTRDADAKASLAPAHFNQPCVTSAAAVLTFCADFNRVSRWARERNADPGFDNVQSFVSAMLDATILAQQFVTIAETRGWGTCYLGTTTWNAPQIIDALALPKLVIPVITVTIGRPDEAPGLQPRLPVESLMFDEKYVEADINATYSELESLPQSAQFMRENDKPTLAAVFTDVRYPRSANEQFSEIFIDVLRKQGFLK